MKNTGDRLLSASRCAAGNKLTNSRAGHTSALLICVLLVTLYGCNADDYPSVHAFAETDSVPDEGDAADDPAIWVHPSEPDKSLVLGTNKRRGLEVYDLHGNRIQSLELGNLNNVDVRQEILWGGETIDLAVATNRSTDSLSLFSINRETGLVVHLIDEEIALKLSEPYGVCLYKAGSTAYAFVNDKDGSYQQWLLAQGKESRIVRTFKLESQPEGCVVDDVTHTLYFGEEERGVWKRDAAHDSETEATLIATISETPLVADVEGLTIYRANIGEGYLLVSSQGDDSFALFDLSDNDRYVGSFRVSGSQDGSIDAVTGTDGIDVVGSTLGPELPNGLFVVQDDENRDPRENQSFKYIDWRKIKNLLASESLDAET